MGVLRPQSSAVSPRRNSACSPTAVGSQKNPVLLPVHCSHTATWVTSGHLLRRKEKSNQVPAVQSSTINYLASFCYILSSLDASSLNLFTFLFFFSPLQLPVVYLARMQCFNPPASQEPRRQDATHITMLQQHSAAASRATSLIIIFPQ